MGLIRIFVLFDHGVFQGRDRTDARERAVGTLVGEFA